MKVSDVRAIHHLAIDRSLEILPLVFRTKGTDGKAVLLLGMDDHGNQASHRGINSRSSMLQSKGHDHGIEVPAASDAGGKR